MQTIPRILYMYIKYKNTCPRIKKYTLALLCGGAPKSKRLRQKRDFSFSPLKWSRISTDTFSAHRISDEFSPHGFFWKRGRKSGQIKNATIWRKTRPAIFSGLKHTHSNDDFQTLVRVGKPLFSLLGSSYLV